MDFTVTLYAVLMMFAVGAVGFFMKKANLVTDNAPKDLSKVLIYVCQPCLLWYSFNKCECNEKNLINIGITFFAVSALICIVILSFYLIFRKKYDNVKYRVCTVGAGLSNFAFFGIPVLQAIFPDKISDLMVISATAALVMNILGWSLCCYVFTGDKKYVSVKKILLNPSVLILVIVLPLFFCNVRLGGAGNSFAAQLGNTVELAGRASTVVFMLVLGMRLASSDIKEIFCSPLFYALCVFKQMLLPLLVFGIFYFIPVAEELKQTLFVLFCCPIASVTLNYAEMVGKGQNDAANLVLLSVILSVVTLPVMTLLL